MSIHRDQRSGGSVVWRVRWRDGGRGSAERMRTFTRKADAQRFEDELRRRRRLGEIGLLLGSQETLDTYVTETWAPTYAVTLSPTTAKDYGVTDPSSAAQSIAGGAKHLARLLRLYDGDRMLAAAAYNAGEGTVARYGGVPPYAETTAYVAKVDALYALYRQALQ